MSSLRPFKHLFQMGGLVLMVLFFANCAPKLDPQRAHSETPLADEAKKEILQNLEQSLAGRRDQLHFLRGYIRARLKLRGQTQRFEGAFFLKLKNATNDNDARFRLEVLDDFANERLLIFSDGKTLFWKEKGSDETLQIDLKNPAHDSKAAKKARKFIPRLFFEADALGLFAGILSREMFDLAVVQNVFKTAEGYEIEGAGGSILLGEQKNILEIRLNPQSHGYRYTAGHFVKIEKKGARQNPRLGTPLLELPLEIFWKDQRSKSELVIEYQTIDWTDSLSEKLFLE